MERGAAHIISDGFEVVFTVRRKDFDDFYQQWAKTFGPSVIPLVRDSKDRQTRFFLSDRVSVLWFEEYQR